MGFSILDELTQQEITTKTEQLTQKLSGEAKTLALVEFYQKNKLNDEAIDQLESLIKENHKNAAIYHKLGEIYQQIQLPLLARDNYLKAVELIPDEDIAGIAEVQADLGQIYRTLGQKKEAVYWLTLAYNQYQQLGEQQRQTEIKQLVEQISQSTL
jgi:tetratricopeptide (TPR) repeat protein